MILPRSRAPYTQPSPIPGTIRLFLNDFLVTEGVTEDPDQGWLLWSVYHNAASPHPLADHPEGPQHSSNALE